MNLPDADIEVLVRTDNPEREMLVGYHDGDSWRVAITDHILTDRVLGWADTDAAIKQVKWNT